MKSEDRTTRKVEERPPTDDDDNNNNSIDHASQMNGNDSDTDTESKSNSSYTNATAIATGASALCQQARTLWLQNATKRTDLDRVEELYRRALNSKREIIVKKKLPVAVSTRKEEESKRESKDRQKKRDHSGSKTTVSKTKTVAELSAEEYRSAGERLSLLFIQSGRPSKAAPGLQYLGFVCRLSEKILNYATTNTSSKTTATSLSGETENGTSQSASQEPPCCVIDDFLSSAELTHLRKVFEDTSSSYWTSHHYIIDKEPPAPYFSYVIDLKESQNKNNNDSNATMQEEDLRNGGFLRSNIIDKILSNPDIKRKFPRLREDARYVELWAHNRPHASGHQLHFDSDDEGRTKSTGGDDDDKQGMMTYPKHPIVSTVLYLSTSSTTTKVGGPTLITNQRLRNPETTNLNSVRGWLVSSKPSRLVCFDGSVLHGVIPGKGVIPSSASTTAQKRPRRVTLMMAFWKDIQTRPGKKPGSARPWPTLSSTTANTTNNAVMASTMKSSSLPSWAIELNRTDVAVGSDNDDDSDKNGGMTSSVQQQDQQIVPIRDVYERFDGSAVPKYHDNNGGYYMPEYDRVFQGF